MGTFFTDGLRKQNLKMNPGDLSSLGAEKTKSESLSYRISGLSDVCLFVRFEDMVCLELLEKGIGGRV